MSATRAQHRREQRAAAKNRTVDPRPITGLPDAENFGITIAWASTELDLPEARQMTHDHLIALMGDRRTGGVQWVHHRGREAIQMTNVIGTEAAVEVRKRLLARGGYLVVALAPGDPAPGVEPIG